MIIYLRFYIFVIFSLTFLSIRCPCAPARKDRVRNSIGKLSYSSLPANSSSASSISASLKQ